MLPNWKTILKEGILETMEYTTEYITVEETTIQTKIVLLTLFASGLLLDGMPLWRHNCM